MNPSTHAFTWSRPARIAALGAGLLLLAGCVMPYSYVQGGYGGGYYTSSGPAPGYYYDQSGYAYYGGSGYGYAYGPPVGLTLGITSGWGWPGYYGYGGYGYQHTRHWSGGDWHHHSSDHTYHYGHGSWGGSSSYGGSRPAGGGQTWQPHAAARPLPAPAPAHAPASRLHAPSTKQR